MKIIILGNSGSGKSTMAGYLRLLLGIPIIELDTLLWKDGKRLPNDERVHIVNELAENDNYIMCGDFYPFEDNRLQLADHIIFINENKWKCLWRVCDRVLSGGNHGWKYPTLDLIKWIVQYDKVVKPYLAKLMKCDSCKLDNPKDTRFIVVKDSLDIHIVFNEMAFNEMANGDGKL